MGPGLIMRNDIRKAAKDLRKYGRDVERAATKASLKTAQEGLKAAVKSSSGAATQKQLAKEGHPYAVSHLTTGANVGFGLSTRNPSIINAITGKFRDDWHLASRLSDRSVTIVNFSKVAGYLEEGTKYMIARPIETRIIAAMSKVGINNLDREVQKINR